MTRLTLVGAGRAVFACRLLSAGLSIPDLAEVSVALHDIDENRLLAQ